MKRFDTVITRIFLFGLPLIVLMTAVASFIDSQTLSSQPKAIQTFHDATGLLFGLWLLFSAYLCVRLVISANFRSTVLTKLTFFRERDEREVHLSGQATRTVFLTSLALLVTLTFFSALQVAVRPLPPERITSDKKRELTLGLAFSFTEDEGELRVQQSPSSPSYFEFSGPPLSKQGIMLLLLLWQVAVYNYCMRRNRSVS